MIFLLCREQKVRGMHPRVLVYERDTAELLPQFEQADIPVHFSPKGPGFSIRLPFRILAVLRAHDISLIHSHDLGALIYACLVKLLSFGRVRVVHTQHSFQHLSNRKARLYERIFPWLADVVVCVSEDLRRTYLSIGQSWRRLRVIPNGVDFNVVIPTLEARHAGRLRLLERHGLPESLASKCWVVTLGRLVPVKGPQHALRFWATSHTEGAALFCVGPEIERDFVAELRGAARENVFFPGASLDPQSWLEAADLFLSASEFEGMPLAGLEAAAARLPMLLSDVPGHALFRKWAAYFPLNDLGIAKSQLEKFLAIKSFGEGSGELLALKRLKRDCGTARMVEAYLRLYT